MFKIQPSFLLFSFTAVERTILVSIGRVAIFMDAAAT